VAIICLSLGLTGLVAVNVFYLLRASPRVAAFSPLAQTNLGEIVVLNDSPEGQKPDRAEAKADKAKAEADKVKAKADKAKAEADKAKAEADTVKAEAAKVKAERESR
jgi:uncharacterized membrane protein YqiK